MFGLAANVSSCSHVSERLFSSCSEATAEVLGKSPELAQSGRAGGATLAFVLSGHLYRHSTGARDTSPRRPPSPAGEGVRGGNSTPRGRDLVVIRAVVHRGHAGAGTHPIAQRCSAFRRKISERFAAVAASRVRNSLSLLVPRRRPLSPGRRGVRRRARRPCLSCALFSAARWTRCSSR